MSTWLEGNWLELTGAMLGVAYVLLAMRQSIWCWPVGILNVSLYIGVFFSARLFGDMVLQAFYLVMGIYGWYQWKYGKSKGLGGKGLPISRIPAHLAVTALVATALMSVVFGNILSGTVSTLPYWDGTTTALGLTGTWMTARKYLENWLVWVFADLLSAGIYVYKELYPTVGFYILLTIVAAIAYRQWKRDMKQQAA